MTQTNEAGRSAHTKHYARRKARALAVQALYQQRMAPVHIDELVEKYAADVSPKKVDVAYFSEAVTEIVGDIDTFDALLQPACDRPLADLSAAEHSILRLATYELTQRLDMPYPVIVSEACRLAKRFGSVDGYKYVNAVVEKLASEHRPAEIKARPVQLAELEADADVSLLSEIPEDLAIEDMQLVDQSKPQDTDADTDHA